MSLKVCVLKGGISSEREISLKSGQAIERALKELGYFVFNIDYRGPEELLSLKKREVDVVFIALHGVGGEDGRIQGWLETMGIPYTGSDVLASALAMDKSFSRRIWKTEGLKQPYWQVIDSPCFSLKISPPFIVKPARGGSTIGVSLVREEKEVETAIREAFKHDSECIIVEEYIEGREITVGIIDDPQPKALPIIEIVHRKGIFDYTTKYTKGLCDYIVPAEFSLSESKKIKDIAIRAYKSLGCRDFGRVDLIWRKGEAYLLEVNTIPGMTDNSLLPRAAKAEGIEFNLLVDKIVKRAICRRG